MHPLPGDIHVQTRFRLGALVLSGLLAVTSLSLSAGAASAHDGEDHGDEIAATTWANYEKVTLTKDVGEPIDMAVLPDSRVLHTTRGGQVRLTDPSQGTTTVVNTIDVYANSEDGLQTITLDPDFEENGWVYLYYAPRTMTAPYPATTPTGSAPNSLPAGADASYWDQWKGHNQLSRFKWNSATSSLDLSTDRPSSRSRCSAASAATSPAMSPSTTTATCCSPRATTRRRAHRARAAMRR